MFIVDAPASGSAAPPKEAKPAKAAEKAPEKAPEPKLEVPVVLFGLLIQCR